MGLYDGYNLANSSRVKQYQGSVVPELVGVSQQLQKQYDTSQANMDYTSRYLNGLQAHNKDQGALDELRTNYTGKIKGFAQRKDLENAVRETSMLAQQLPDDYAPFAGVLKQRQEYNELVDKSPDLRPETKEKLKGISDANYQGLQKDPSTGRYKGSFAGRNFVKDLNPMDRADKYVKDKFPVEQGYSVENTNGTYIIKNGKETKILTPDDVKSLVYSGAQSDSEFQAWLKQEQELNTYTEDYSHTSPEQVKLQGGFNNYSVQGLSDKGGQFNGHFQINNTPVNAQEAVQQALDQGYSLTEAVKMVKSKNIEDKVLNGMFNYAVTKYSRNDVKTEQGLKEDGYGVAEYSHKLADQGIPIAAQLLQPSANSKYDSPSGITSAIKNYDDANRQQYEQYSAWTNKNGIKPNGSPYDPNTKWFDANGNERTSEARVFIDAQLQASTASKQLEEKKQKLMDAAGYKITPELERKAKSAYDATIKNYEATGKLANASSPSYIPQLKTAKKEAEDAYDRILATGENYGKYKQLIAEDAKENLVPVGITTSGSISTDKAILETFKSLVVNLDGNKLGAGTQGLEWAAGDNVGKALSSGDYAKLIGETQYAGSGIDADGQYKMYFNVGTTKVNTKGERSGENVLVKLPAFSGVAENMVKNGLITKAQQIISQSVLQGIKNSENGTTSIEVSDQFPQVTVRKVNASDKSTFNNNSSVNYIISYPTPDGKFKDVTATGIDQVVGNIIETVQKHLKK